MSNLLTLIAFLCSDDEEKKARGHKTKERLERTMAAAAAALSSQIKPHMDLPHGSNEVTTSNNVSSSASFMPFGKMPVMQSSLAEVANAAVASAMNSANIKTELVEPQQTEIQAEVSIF